MSNLVTNWTIGDVLGRRAVRPVYQPIVDLDTGLTVGYESLARGPEGSNLERPDQLFGAAEENGCVAELDWECRAVAMAGAVAAGLRSPARLFVNVEPRSFATRAPQHLVAELANSQRNLDVVVEVTERALTANPAAMIEALRWIRERGFGIAIDDVGADPASLAMMPIIRPDVIKLDLRLIQRRADADVSAIACAVMAQAEETGALILAEGIETPEHLATARSLGAKLGQGWHFGRPGPIRAAVGIGDVFGAPAAPHASPLTPWAALPVGTPVRTATKAQLLPMSHHIESSALSSSTPPVVVAAFQDACHFTSATAQRYLSLSRHCSFIAAVGVGLPSTPVAGVRGAAIAPNHPLRGEWTVANLGPFEASALIARDLGDSGPDMDRRFSYTITHRRDTVIDVVRSILSHLEPEATAF